VLSGDSAITLHASIATTASAIKIDGQGGGARVQFDIPEQDLLRVVQLTALRETALIVTVRPE
jgi:hypothetical protein